MFNHGDKYQMVLFLPLAYDFPRCTIRTSTPADRANEQQAAPSGVIINHRDDLLRSSRLPLAEMKLLSASSPFFFRRYIIFCLLYSLPINQTVIQLLQQVIE